MLLLSYQVASFVVQPVFLKKSKTKLTVPVKDKSSYRGVYDSCPKPISRDFFFFVFFFFLPSYFRLVAIQMIGSYRPLGH